jgi:hypothetical protein
MKTKICILGIFAFVTLVVAAPHTWALKTGEPVTGDYVSSGTTTLVVKTGGTNCFLKISELSTNDRSYFQECKAAQRQHQLDAEATQMRAAGQIELTADLIKNFPERVRSKQGWMDAKFYELDKLAGRSSERDLGFDVEDSNGKLFMHCCVSKLIYGPNPLDDTKPNPFVDEISNLKTGDKVRFFGGVDDPRTDGFGGYVTYHFFIHRIEMIESAADKKAREQAAKNP